MQVECISKFGLVDVGDTVELPDGASFDLMHFRKVEPEPEPEAAPKAKAKSIKKEEG